MHEFADQVFVYRIDERDTLVFVTDAWICFARENGMPHLSSEMVLGRPLWDCVAGLEMRHLLSELVQRVRQTGTELSVPFRCDSPDCRRWLEMRIIPLPERGVEFHHTVLRSEPRSPVRLLDTTVPRSDEWLPICGWCKRIQLVTERWVEIEEAVGVLRLSGREALPRLQHVICPDCNQTVRSRLA